MEKEPEMRSRLGYAEIYPGLSISSYPLPGPPTSNCMMFSWGLVQCSWTPVTALPVSADLDSPVQQSVRETIAYGNLVENRPTAHGTERRATFAGHRRPLLLGEKRWIVLFEGWGATSHAQRSGIRRHRRSCLRDYTVQ